MQVTVATIAELLGGTVEGNPEVLIDRPSKIEEGGAGSISFLGNLKYEAYAYTTTASALLVAHDFQPKTPIAATLIRVPDVYAAVATLLQQFGGEQTRQPGISEQACISESARFGEGVTVGGQTVIEAGAQIGNHCIIYPQVYIGPGVKLGDHCLIYPGVRILKDCVLGKHCIVHANAVIGSDGFGFAPQEDGSYQKIAHVGNVLIEDEVEIGAQTSIDRATMGSTIIRRGVKLDNLIQVGHNVEIGEHTVIAAQAGIAGSTKIGRNCRIGGQVGFAGHITIADGTQIQAQSGLAASVEVPNQSLFGSPAIGYRDFIRAHAIFKKLPELYRQLARLEKKLKGE